MRSETTTATSSFDTLAFFCSGTGLYDGPQAVFDGVTVIHSGDKPAPRQQMELFLLLTNRTPTR